MSRWGGIDYSTALQVRELMKELAAAGKIFFIRPTT
jgi:hypothetical protein